MAELLLCNEPMAAVPYYVEGIGLNVYSLEELSYYLKRNTDLIEREFMNEDLCSWIERELDRSTLVLRLRKIMEKSGTLSQYVTEILLDCGYCTGEEIQKIQQELEQLENKSEFECSKIRADRLLERERYISSIYEYRRLLESEESREADRVILGNIWNNLGTAYARLFLFREAERCYRKAYHYNENEESLIQCLYAIRCCKDEAGFLAMAKENYLEDEEIQKIREDLTAISRGEETIAFEQRLEQIAERKEEGKTSEYQQQIHEIIYGWKEAYRRVCGI